MNDKKHDIEPTADMLPKEEVDRIIHKLESTPKDWMTAEEMEALLHGGDIKQEPVQDNGREM